MKLMVYDKFWDAFMNLSKTTQKKVIDFQKKFKANSKSSAIHLEPISTFKDPSLRTARIDQKYRAIIKVPESGSAYYLLWVDNHDEAMAWAENKLFQWNDTTQSVQVFTAPDTPTTSPTLPSTVSAQGKGRAAVAVAHQGEAYAYQQMGLLSEYTDEQLLQVGIPAVLLPSVKMIQTMDDLEKLESYLPTDAFENIFYLLDGANIALLIAEIAAGRTNVEDPDAQAGSSNNRRSFIELTDDAIFNEVLSGQLDKWKYYLHPSQRKLVDADFKGPVKITGGAGTGKTVAALHRFKSLAPNGTVEQPVLFTTFTNALTDNIQHLAAELDIPRDRTRICTLDSLVVELAHRYQLKESKDKVFGFGNKIRPSEVWADFLEGEVATYDKAFLMEEYEQVILYYAIQDVSSYLKVSRVGRGKPISRRQRADLWKLFDRFQAYKKTKRLYYKAEWYNEVCQYLSTHQLFPFTHAIVDELQDFSNVELRFIRSLVPEKPNDLFLVGDPFQAIYARRIHFSEAGINVRGKRSQRLRINYRTTEEIKRLAISIISETSYEDFDGGREERNGYVSLFHGLPPQYHIFKQKEEELDFIHGQLEELIQLGYFYPDIAISARTKQGLKDIEHSLHQHKLPYYTKKGASYIGHREGIALLTFHNMKGLEFKHVFLLDVNHRTAPYLFSAFEHRSSSFQARYLQSEKSLLYVAISRGIERVSISGTGQKSDWIGI